MKSILDPSFVYRNAAETDLRKTFARVRRRMRKEEEAKKSTAEASVTSLFDHPPRKGVAK